jgi:metal-responsive CopG/Arc/MetJ family transcriptional regulator
MPLRLRFRRILQPLLGKRGVDWMKPRTKQPTRPIHVTLPITMLQDFDATLRYNQSRSKKIASLIENHMDGGRALVHEATTRELMHVLCARKDVDVTMKTLLLQVLSQSS